MTPPRLGPGDRHNASANFINCQITSGTRWHEQANLLCLVILPTMLVSIILDFNIRKVGVCLA
jgi:hypothetical protein